MKRNNWSLFRLPVSLFLVLAMVLSVQPVFGHSKDHHHDNDKQVRMYHDGTVRVAGQEFSNVREYFRSEYFRASGKRCGLHKHYSPERLRELREADRQFASASDCTLSRTTIQNEYYPSQTLTIPIVFHIIHKSDGTGNISDSRITNQVKALNEDYAATAGSMGANGYNTKIQFQLVTITRTENDNWFNDNDEYGYKSTLGYNTSKYLNVYVNSASGYLGYATLPQSDAGSTLDGVVVLYSATGGRGEGDAPYNQGRTLTHEIGHYLGLLHTFEGYGCYTGYTQGDLINDTNSENDQHFGCTQENSCGTPDEIHNYMNYTDDSCMYEFSPEQANRMVCSMMNYRPQLYSTGSSSPTITVTNPNGGESLTSGSSETITWSTSGTVGDVKIEYSTNNGSSWTTIVSSTDNDGSYSWTVPSVSTSQALIKISEASDGSPSDTSNSTFTIGSGGSDSIRVTNPNGGETLVAGASETITWSTTGSVGNVKIEYSTNNGTSWTTITSSTSNDGSYSWTVPSVSTSSALIRIKQASGGSPSDTSDTVFTISLSGSPTISLSRSQLIFGGISGVTQSLAQRVWISNSGTGSLSWSTGDNSSWLSCSPASGMDASVLTISVNAAALSAGTYYGTVTVRATGASNSPQYIGVTFKVINSYQNEYPMGSLDTPLNNATVAGSIPVTGWALDDVGIKKVKIYADNTYIDDALLVDGARSDIESAYPTYPGVQTAGWGYMMLTNYLPNGGQGYYTISAVAEDVNGLNTNLGSRQVYVDNANAAKPFGAIDTPIQGGTASGTSFVNWGWALTPQPNWIPTSGSTIKVLVNGKFVGNPTYGLWRSDIASLFPGYTNSNTAVGHFSLDTSAYDNGVHTIQWTVTDDDGNTDGIGSRFFTTLNSSRSGTAGTSAVITAPPMSIGEIKETLNRDVHLNKEAPIRFRKGLNEKTALSDSAKDNAGISRINIRELERVVVHLDGGPIQKARWTGGYHMVGNTLRQLPAGSTFDTQDGVFYWSPGPGFVGEYTLVFVNAKEKRVKQVMVTIGPKLSSKQE